jgi:DNA adenine methylase
MEIVKPLIKWVGGKTQILETVLTHFPSGVINNYREPFLGGGSVLFAVLAQIHTEKIKITGKIYAYDLNEALIFVYKNIQTHHRELYNEIQLIIDEFRQVPENADEIDRKPKTIIDAKKTKENYYYWIRQKYNEMADKKTVTASAAFIFLNKTCFRGIFRVGPNGFNVPYGHYKNPEIINREHLDKIHTLIREVVFECCDFSVSLNAVQENDFIYIDPPYVPETVTSFVCYTEHGFNLEQHATLFRLLHNDISHKKIDFVLSNSDVAYVRENFPPDKYAVHTISCKRNIHSKKPQTKTNEVLIRPHR